MSDPIVRMFNLYHKPGVGESIPIPIPPQAALLKIQIVYLGGAVSGRIVTRDQRQWFDVDPESISEGKLWITRALFPEELPDTGFNCTVGYMTEETLKAAQEYGVEIPISPVKALAINERAFVIELEDGLKIAIDRSHFDTFARQASNGVRSKVNFVTGEASSSNRGNLNFSDKSCSGCKKPNPFTG